MNNISIGHVVVLIGLSLILSACSIMESKRQADVVENLSSIEGSVQISAKSASSPIRVLLLRKDSDLQLSVVNQFVMEEKGKFLFHVRSGRYMLVAYLDDNDDGVFQEDEKAGFVGHDQDFPAIIEVKDKKNHQVGTIFIERIIKRDGKYKVNNHLLLTKISPGRIVSLDDPMFSTEYASMGLWRPLEFIEKVGGGLYLFEEYQEDKIPVLFIHGINGSVSSWAKAIKQLDRNTFQPIALYYASGLRLDMVSDYLVKAVNELHIKYKFNEFYVVAHSMGGLVARSFVKKYETGNYAADIGLFMTVNSPMMGMDSAKSGIKHSPIVIPSWRDVASGSEFVKDIMNWDVPKTIPYYLFFSYKSGKGGDGVVRLESQIPPKLQKEAIKMYGFNGDHTGILAEDIFIKRFNQVLKSKLVKHEEAGDR